MYKGVHEDNFIQPLTLARQDVVITTYETLKREFSYVDLPHSNSECWLELLLILILVTVCLRLIILESYSTHSYIYCTSCSSLRSNYLLIFYYLLVYYLQYLSIYSLYLIYCIYLFKRGNRDILQKVGLPVQYPHWDVFSKLMQFI